jgi:hypothetical protein
MAPRRPAGAARSPAIKPDEAVVHGNKAEWVAEVEISRGVAWLVVGVSPTVRLGKPGQRKCT